jgi:hypothetical protein
VEVIDLLSCESKPALGEKKRVSRSAMVKKRDRSSKQKVEKLPIKSMRWALVTTSHGSKLDRPLEHAGWK